MTNHLGRGPGIVLVVLAVVLGACPTAQAQQDVDRVVSEAIDKWNEGSPVSREQALQSLGSLGRDARPAIPQLIGALRDPNPRIACRVAAFIEQVGTAPKESVPALTALLKDPDAAVRDAAASALATLGRRAEGSIGAMVESLHAPADRRCLRAAFALATIGEAALPALFDLLKADDPALRRAAIRGHRRCRRSVALGWQCGRSRPRAPLSDSGQGPRPQSRACPGRHADQHRERVAARALRSRLVAPRPGLPRPAGPRELGQHRMPTSRPGFASRSSNC